MSWKEYLEELYEGNDEATANYIGIQEIYRVKEDELGPSIIKTELNKAIHDLKSNKKVCIDEIPAELWKVVGEEMRDILFKMLEKTYREGIVPKDFTKSRTILIAKKENTTECNNYRTISLLRHVSIKYGSERK